MTKEEIKLVMQWCLPLETTPKKLNELVETFINEYKEAINYSCSSKMLKDKHKINFDDWVKTFYKKTPEEYYINRINKNQQKTLEELKEMYKEVTSDF